MAVDGKLCELLMDRYPDVMKPMLQLIAVHSTDDTVEEDEQDDEEEETVAAFLELDCSKDDQSHMETLYDTLDFTMWGADIHAPGPARLATFQETGETFVIKIGGDGLETSIDIPLEFYPERYLTSRKDEAVKMQKAWMETKSNK